jgi:hypothetical protein
MICNSVKSLIIFTMILFTGCVATHHSTEKQNAWKPEYRIQAGINQGGIVENTDLEQIPNTGVDAFTGATRAGFNAGAHVVIPLWINSVETGIDFMHNNQTFNYNDEMNAYAGKRKAGVSQLMWPLTYNFGVFRKNNANGLLQIKIGHVLQYNMITFSESGPQLPDYSVNRFSNGITLGVSAMPFTLTNGTGVGFYLDLYRGSQIFEDFYNRKDFEIPGSSYMKAGIIYQLPSK